MYLVAALEKVVVSSIRGWTTAGVDESLPFLSLSIVEFTL